MSHRRARPTLRLLTEDLAYRLDDAGLERALREGRVQELHPLSGLPHPIIEKAAAAFSENPDEDNPEGRIRSSKSLELWEVKVSRWRGGVWISDTGVCWLVVCGLAKGDHEDYDDFYKRIERLEAAAEMGSLAPTESDLRLWKREVVAEALEAWGQTVQGQVMAALGEVQGEGSASFQVPHPLADRLPKHDQVVSSVQVDMTRCNEVDYSYEDIVVTFDTAARWSGSDIEWEAILRVLISISPPEQGWDRYKQTFSNMAEPGTLAARRRTLQDLVDVGKLAESEPGQHAHQAHRQSLTERTVNGQAARALCGAFFVPRQDHESLPQCPTCAQRIEELDSLA